MVATKNECSLHIGNAFSVWKQFKVITKLKILAKLKRKNLAKKVKIFLLSEFFCSKKRTFLNFQQKLTKHKKSNTRECNSKRRYPKDGDPHSHSA
jgi:hypothetical protein